MQVLHLVVLVQVENGGVATALDNFQSHPGVAHEKAAGVGIFIIREQSQQPGVVAFTYRMHLGKINFEGLSFRPLQHHFKHTTQSSIACNDATGRSLSHASAGKVYH